MEKIALFKGNLRYNNIFNSLNLIKKEIKEKLKNKERIIIKPNCVSDSVQLASTNVKAIKAVLDFIMPLNKSKITIAEGSAYSTKTAFKNFNYYSLKNYNINFIDLNNDEFEEIEIFDKNMNKIKVGISKTMLNSDCIISLALLKTHDSAIATFGIKNICVGSLIKRSFFSHRISNKSLRKIINRISETRNDKFKIHQGPKAINKNIFEIYKKIKPDISIIDGFKAMQGNGPVDGFPVKMNLAIAGINPVIVDIVSAQLIGLKPEDIGYLNYCIEYEKISPQDIKIIGNTTVKKEMKKFKMHKDFNEQMKWKFN